MSAFEHNNKKLTITVYDLTDAQDKVYCELKNGGNSEELALWKIEHSQVDLTVKK